MKIAKQEIGKLVDIEVLTYCIDTAWNSLAFSAKRKSAGYDLFPILES